MGEICSVWQDWDVLAAPPPLHPSSRPHVVVNKAHGSGKQRILPLLLSPSGVRLHV